MSSDKWYNLLGNQEYEDYTGGQYEPITYNSDFNNFTNSLQSSQSGAQLDTGGSFFGSMGSMFGPMAQMFQSMSMLNDGVKMAIDGSKFQAGVYRSSGKAALQGSKFEASVLRDAGNNAVQISKYNIALDQEQTARQNDALSRQVGDVLSANYAVAGATGASIYSKSTMMVQQEVAGNAERAYRQNINDAKQRQAVIQYQGALTQTQYENQARGAEYQGAIAVQQAENNARAAEYQGQVDAYKQKSVAAQTIGGSIGKMFSSFGGM